MALRLEDKKQIVAQVAEFAQAARSVVAAENRGLTVHQMTSLRSEARKKGVAIHVVRNTLARRAFEGTEFECMRPILVGPLMLAFANKELSAAARLFRDFCKDNEALEVKGLSIGGQLLPADQLEFVAQLPTREEAIAKVLQLMKASVTQLVRTIAEPHTQLVRAVSAVGDKKQAA